MIRETDGGPKKDHQTEKKQHPKTVNWESLPQWQRDNHYILTGYRPASNSYLISLQSFFEIHNETVNVHSHYVGALAFVLAAPRIWDALQPSYPTASATDVLVMSCFFAGAVACMAMSATFHLVCNHSERVCTVGNQLDYLGIVFLIWGSFIPSIYYGFVCDTLLRNTYWSMVSRVHAFTTRRPRSCG